MLGEDVRAGGKIGDGASELDDAGAGACGQAHIVDNLFKQDLAFLAQRAVFLYVLVVHRGVAENTFFCKSSFLHAFPSLSHFVECFLKKTPQSPSKNCGVMSPINNSSKSFFNNSF